jgi:HPt (histidine-containing phosphotransfer) domain-containing protein
MDSIEKFAMNDAIDSLWAKFLPQMRERVAILETSATAFAADQLPDAQRSAASTAAHKLAGVLGTFGLTRGTVLARELEIMYSQENGPDPATASKFAEIAAELRTLVESRK